MGRADAGESRGCMWRRLRTIIAACTGVVMRKRARSTPRRSAKFWSAREGKATRLRHLSQKLCRASQDKLCFRQIISRRCIAGYALEEGFALLMKCKSDLADSERTSGDLRRKPWFRTLWCLGSRL